MATMKAHIAHVHQSADDAENVIKKNLRDHIAKILKKIPRGDRPVVALDRPSNLFGAIPG
jgi:hypothetical protein